MSLASEELASKTGVIFSLLHANRGESQANAKRESSAREGARARLALRARLAFASVGLFCRLIRSGGYENEILNAYEVGERVRDEKVGEKEIQGILDDYDDDDLFS